MLKRRLRGIDPRVLLQAIRTPVLTLTAFGAVDYGVWQLSHAAGWVAAGISLLALEWLSEGDEDGANT